MLRIFKKFSEYFQKTDEAKTKSVIANSELIVNNWIKEQ